MLKRITALILAVGLLFADAAFASEYIENKQVNYDAYTYTKMVESYKYSTQMSGGDYGGYFGYTTGTECIVFKNMDFGRCGAVSVEVSYAVSGEYSGILEFRKNSASGELIAQLKSEDNGSWDIPKTRTAEVEFPTSASGRFDLYVLIKKSTFGNIYGFKFNETPTAYQTINAKNSLKAYTGFSGDDIMTDGISVNFNNPQLLGNDYTRHLDYYVSFGNKASKEFVIDAEVEIGGRMRIYDNCPDGELLAEIKLSEGDGERRFEAGEKIASLFATQNLCFAFDNSMKMKLKSFSFVSEQKLNIEEAVFDTTNFSSYNSVTVNSDKGFFGGISSSDSYICWENVDFGDTVWPMRVKLIYGVGTANNGYEVNIRIDSNKGQVIAKIPMPMKDGGGWEVQMEETGIVTLGVTGVHNLYATIEDSKYKYGAKAGNIFSIDFDIAKEKYASSYNMLSYNKEPKELKANVAFLGSEDNPESMLYSFAVYDSENRLVSIDSRREEASEGLNVFERTLDFGVMNKPDEYTVKVYLWDEMLRPIKRELPANYVITAD